MMIQAFTIGDKEADSAIVIKNMKLPEQFLLIGYDNTRVEEESRR